MKVGDLVWVDHPSMPEWHHKIGKIVSENVSTPIRWNLDFPAPDPSTASLTNKHSDGTHIGYSEERLAPFNIMAVVDRIDAILRYCDLPTRAELEQAFDMTGLFFLGRYFGWTKAVYSNKTTVDLMLHLNMIRIEHIPDNQLNDTGLNLKHQVLEATT